MSPKHISAVKTLRRTVDDFTCIRGIGSVTEKRLYGAGIHTYSQLARLSVQAIQSLTPNFSENQIKKQDWIGQARKLEPVKTKPKHTKKKNIAMSRQHYENFTVEFLLDEKNKIHRMRAVHVQSGDVGTWATWNTGRLIDFLAWHTGTHLSYVKTTHPHIIKTKPVLNPAAKLEEPAELVAKESSPESTIVVTNNLTTDTTRQEPLRTPASTPAASQIHLLGWNTVLANTTQPLHNIPHDQPFDVRLILDLADMHLKGIVQLNSTVTLFAKKLGNGHQRAIQENQEIVPYVDTITLTVAGVTLSEGMYRLDACLTLIPMETSTEKDIVKESFRGGLFQVY